MIYARDDRTIKTNNRMPRTGVAYRSRSSYIFKFAHVQVDEP